jgi:hypothetical protein
MSNDWKDPALGFCEDDMMAHGGTSVGGGVASLDCARKRSKRRIRSMARNDSLAVIASHARKSLAEIAFCQIVRPAVSD